MTEPKSPKRRRLRVLRIVLGMLAVLIVAGVAAVTFVLHHLETPAVKARLQALVKKATGIELEYEAAHAALGSGLHLDNVTIATAAGCETSRPSSCTSAPST